MKIPKIKPRPKYVFIKPDSEDSRESAHGIVTPANVEQEKKAVGEVLYVGSEVKEVKPKDRVIFGTFAGDAIQIDGVDYKFLHEDDILGIYEK